VAIPQQSFRESTRSSAVHNLDKPAFYVALRCNESEYRGLMKLSIGAALVAGLILSATATAEAGGNQCGGASWYGPGFNGKKTASGERFNQNAMTAAHRTLPLGTVIKVTDQRTGKSVKVTINDRGPFSGGRIIDLSKGAATRLGFVARGTTKVCLAQN
jgi:rare lipoprotein A